VSCIDSNDSDDDVSGNGRIYDALIGDVIIWKQHEFHTWWNTFESHVNHPLSRTFVNAFVDALELKGLLNTKRGLFGQRKFDKELKLLSSTLGWGFVDLQQRCVTQSAHSLLSVALAQYALETLGQCRYKVRWVEPRPQAVQLDLETSSNLPSPQSHHLPPWCSLHLDSQRRGSNPTFDIVNDYELRLEGERVVLVPIQAIERFLVACKPYGSPSSMDWFESNVEMNDSNQQLLGTIIQSIASMFLKSDKPVYIIDESSWQSYIDHYLHERGWGSLDVTNYDGSTFELSGSLKKGSHLPFTLGILCGMWERAHGRAYRVSLDEKNDIFLVKIESFLQYQTA